MTTTQDLQLAEKARRRGRFERREGWVHLRGGRRQNVKHTTGHGRGRPMPKFDRRRHTT